MGEDYLSDYGYTGGSKAYTPGEVMQDVECVAACNTGGNGAVIAAKQDGTVWHSNAALDVKEWLSDRVNNLRETLI